MPIVKTLYRNEGADDVSSWVTANYRLIDKNGYSSDFHSHKEYEIYLFHSGECKYLIHNRIYDLKPGDLLLMDGLTLHRANPAPSVPYERSMVHFSPKWLQPVIDVLEIPNLLEPFDKLNNCVLRAQNSNELKKIEHLIKQISQIDIQITDDNRKNKRIKRYEIEAELKILVIELLLQVYKLSKINMEESQSIKSEKDEHVENIATWIEQNFQRKISLDEISFALNLSKFYISHIFKEVTGSTVMEYLMTCRLNQVKYLLEMHPEKSLATISQESGFESSAHFSRFFRKRTGLTPTDYRRQRCKVE